jgi:hypothetical protein
MSTKHVENQGIYIKDEGKNNPGSAHFYTLQTEQGHLDAIYIADDLTHGIDGARYVISQLGTDSEVAAKELLLHGVEHARSLGAMIMTGVLYSESHVTAAAAAFGAEAVTTPEPDGRIPTLRNPGEPESTSFILKVTLQP